MKKKELNPASGTNTASHWMGKPIRLVVKLDAVKREVLDCILVGYDEHLITVLYENRPVAYLLTDIYRMELVTSATPDYFTQPAVQNPIVNVAEPEMRVIPDLVEPEIN